MIDPLMQELIDRTGRKPYRNLFDVPLAEALAEVRTRPVTKTPADNNVKAEDRTIAGPNGDVPVRFYRPDSEANGTLIYYHGGGWVSGSIDSVDAGCREMASRFECLVISVGYRLAPEHKFPAGFDDCYAVALWVDANKTQLNPASSRLFIGGASAGGNLTAAVTLKARDENGPAFDAQILIYPVCDSSLDYPSYDENTTYLNRERMAWYWHQYVRAEQDLKLPYAAPYLAESLKDLPSALVITASHDPLRDEGEAYAARLKREGVLASCLRCEGVIHGFFSASLALPQTQQALQEIQTFLAKA